MTDAIEKAAAGRLERNRIYINMLYGDGFWGVGGKAYTDEELQQELEKGKSSASLSNPSSVVRSNQFHYCPRS